MIAPLTEQTSDSGRPGLSRETVGTLWPSLRPGRFRAPLVLLATTALLLTHVSTIAMAVPGDSPTEAIPSMAAVNQSLDPVGGGAGGSAPAVTA
jgi:hypothetical protein